MIIIMPIIIIIKNKAILMVMSLFCFMKVIIILRFFKADSLNGGEKDTVNIRLLNFITILLLNWIAVLVFT